jgi:hypothetical protein
LTRETGDDKLPVGNIRTGRDYRETSPKNRVSFLEVHLLHLILGLRKCECNEYRSYHPNKNKNDIRILDFIVHYIDGSNDIPVLRENSDFGIFYNWICSGSDMIGIDEISVSELRDAFGNVCERLESIPLKLARLFVYPSPKDSVDFIEMLIGEQEYEQHSVNFECFLESSFRRICEFFFSETQEFKDIMKGRCLAELFGFSGTKDEFNDLCHRFYVYSSPGLSFDSMSEVENNDEREECAVNAVFKLMNFNSFLLKRKIIFEERMDKFLCACCDAKWDTVNRTSFREH